MPSPGCYLPDAFSQMPFSSYPRLLVDPSPRCFPRDASYQVFSTRCPFLDVSSRNHPPNAFSQMILPRSFRVIPHALSQVPPPRRLLLHGWSHWPQQGCYLRDFWGNDTSMNPTEPQQRTHDALKVQKWLDLGIVNDRRRNPKKHHF